MDWMALAEEVWRIRWWFVIPTVALYAIPLLGLIFFPLWPVLKTPRFISSIFGSWERVTSFVRDFIAQPYLIGAAAWHFWQYYLLLKWDHAIFSLSSAALISLSYLARYLKRKNAQDLIDYVSDFPLMHPQEFFTLHLGCSCPLRLSIPKSPDRQICPFDLDFSQGSSQKRIGIINLMRGATNTISIARFITLSEKLGGSDLMRRAASALAIIWSARIMQLIRAKVEIDGRDLLLPPGDPQIFAFNHQSFLDFILAPLVLASRPLGPDRKMPKAIPFFLLAKDHFRNNFIYYRILGLGRAAERLGMIFVDRSGKGGIDVAKASTQAAAEKLLKEKIDLVIFPQGSRAFPYFGIDGDRLDAAYYTVGNIDRMKRLGGHLKKGVAHIAASTAIAFAAKGAARSVHIVPVAIHNAAVACPRKSMFISPGVTIRMDVGEIISLDSKKLDGLTIIAHETAIDQMIGESYNAYVDKLHKRLDDALKTTMQIHARVERRLFEDILTTLDALSYDEIVIAMKAWRGDDYTVHAILDAIYAAPVSVRRQFIGELIHHLQNFSSSDKLLDFRNRIIDTIWK